MSTEQIKVNTLLRVIPRTDADNPSLFWSAYRLTQACETLGQIKPISDRIMSQLRNIDWPWARGVFDTPSIEDIRWEPPYNPRIVSDEDMRKASFAASDVLHYTRSSLDHLVYNVCWMDQGAKQDDTQFPIVDEREKWPRAAAGRLTGMSPHHSDWIQEVQPFNGVEWTKILRDLSNADKHRVGVEVSPTVEFELDSETIHPDPQDRDQQLAAIKNITLHFLLPAVNAHGQEVTKVFDAMFVGAGNLINKFLKEANQPLIQINLPT